MKALRLKDMIGQFVRLTHNVTNKAYGIFTPADLFFVRSAWRGRFELTQLPEHNAFAAEARIISQIPPVWLVLEGEVYTPWVERLLELERRRARAHEEWLGY